jgi:hypothetical protein
MLSDRLLAWIEPRDDGIFLAAFVAAQAVNRAPATKFCSSRDEAHEWILTQAEELAFPSIG